MNKRVSIAPMLDYTDRHYRYMMRQMTKRTVLYTEMVVGQAILRGDREYLLDYSELEHPLVLQVGGNDVKTLSETAKIAEDWGYDEINLNVGCPSERVQDGQFGACLMAKPELVAELVAGMKNVVDIPVTVKHRIGIDDLESYEELHRFVAIVKEAGCQHFIVHARIAILGGLSPKENRKIPPLRYEDVYRLKRDFPELFIEINGGIKTLEAMKEQWQQVDAVMLGRIAYDEPYLFASVDREFYGDDVKISRADVVRNMFPYIEKWTQKGTPLGRISRHFLNLWKGQRGAKIWRRLLSENFKLQEGAIAFLEEALELMEEKNH